MTDQQVSVDHWVDERLATLEPAADWQPSGTPHLGRLHTRARGLRTRRLRRLGLVVVVTIVFVAVPVTRAFGARCLEACAIATSRVAQLWRAEEPAAARPKIVGATIGDLAPDNLGTTADRAVVSLASLRGRVVIVNFWATWCAPCRGEMPLLDALQARYGVHGFEVVGISLDEDGWPAITRFLDEQRVS